MDTLIKETKAYLTGITDLRIEAHPIPQKNAPIFITEQYAFYSMKAGEGKFLGVVLRDPEHFKPSALEKHQQYFPPQDNKERGYKGFVLIADHLAGFVRKRLIEKKISFVVPKVQLYWPELGLEFRTRGSSKAAQKAAERFDPATQAVLIGALNGSYPPPVTPKDLEKKLHYSLMSMTRALSQIEAAGIGKGVKKGRQRFISLPEKASLWKQAWLLLNNPVRETRRLWEHDVPNNCKLLAGESALAEMSALVTPQTATYAVGREQWKKLQKKAIPHLTLDEPGTCAVQVWRYDPTLFAKKGMVDVFSLYLSLKDETDERVELALKEALEAQL
jgi:hypothetical protein